MSTPSTGGARRCALAAAIAATALTTAACGSSSKTSSVSASPSASTVSPHKAVSVPLTVLAGKGQVLTLVKLQLSGKPYMFMVDTGALQSQITTQAAKALHLPKAGPAQKSASLCAFKSQPVTVTDWSLGGAALPKETMLAAKSTFAASKIKGVPYGGSLGSDVMAKLGQVTLDLKGKKAIFGGQAPSGGAAVPLAVHKSHGEVSLLAAATVGKPTSFVVDTGSGRTLIDPKAAAAIGLKPSGPTKTSKSDFCTKQSFTPYTFPDWSLGSVKEHGGTVLATPNKLLEQAHGKVLGMIGLDVLGAKGTLTVDYSGHKLLLGAGS